MGLLLWRAVELGNFQIKHAQEDGVYTYDVAKLRLSVGKLFLQVFDLNDTVQFNKFRNSEEKVTFLPKLLISSVKAFSWLRRSFSIVERGIIINLVRC